MSEIPTNEDKRLHLQFIEKTIDRMAANAFLIKGWSITAIGGLVAIYITHQNQSWNRDLLLLILFLLIIFWGHDAYYLSLERQYRKLYELVSNKDAQDIDYSMRPIAEEGGLIIAAFRPILLWSYGIGCVIIATLMYFQR